ncbi:LEF-9 [Homarus gammarus nudivirus]|uniref:LEF-9 n=1 Tax=Homarus gammarus nudivirus TaxID=2509616 RepID=A0A411HB61_9VIRU|nr:LEF-9 [Homarus gammarus nudivirus]QBB28651.1 LEF-9 [Homarus gammarus nudivirus]
MANKRKKMTAPSATAAKKAKIDQVAATADFIPIDAHHESNPINFKIDLNSIQEPVFPSLIYCLQPITTTNTLTLTVEDMFKFTSVGFQFYICQQHALNSEPHNNCSYCVLFTKYTKTFILKTKYHYFTLPPPSWYSPKVLNFLKTFCMSSCKYVQSSVFSEVEKLKELTSYSLFISMDFIEGSLTSLSTGKTSYIRNNVLASHTCGARATLTIDSTLSPQYAVFPQHIFDQLDLASPLVILNRAPSLKNTCIYAVELLRSEDCNDHTIRLNSYTTEGLHADQDGDELTVYYIKHTGANKPSHDVNMAIAELKRFSWKGGIRHDFAYKPRYEFTQYLKYILYRYDKYFCKNNKLWASIQGSVSEKCNKLMNLGCSIYPKEVDVFIEQLSIFVKNLDPQLVSLTDLLNGTGAIRDVIDSGAKGEKIHIETYLKNLYTIDPRREATLIKNFNGYIESGSKMSISGAYQFIFLEAVNPLTFLKGCVYYNDKILLHNLINSTTFASYCFNPIACEHIFKYIASTCDKLVTEEEVDDYLEAIELE